MIYDVYDGAEEGLYTGPYCPPVDPPRLGPGRPAPPVTSSLYQPWCSKSVRLSCSHHPHASDINVLITTTLNALALSFSVSVSLSLSFFSCSFLSLSLSLSLSLRCYGRMRCLWRCVGKMFPYSGILVLSYSYCALYVLK